MKKVLAFSIPLFLTIMAFIAFFLYLQKDAGKGALQVTSIPKSKVYLNGKFIGETPLCKCESPNMPDVGEYSLKLQPLDNSLAYFEEKIKISKSLLTVIDRAFGKGASSEGSILTLEKINNNKEAQLLVLSFPDNAKAVIDSNSSRNTPFILKNLTDSDHEIKITKDGYKEKTIKIRAIQGYKLTALVYLGVDFNLVNITPTPSIQPSPALVKKVSVLETPTGFLRVRESSSSASLEIGKIYPGESYEFIAEESNWFEIKLKDGKTGWISTQYAKKE